MCGPHFCSMKITEDVRKYAAEQGIAEEEALKKGMEEKKKENYSSGFSDRIGGNIFLNPSYTPPLLTLASLVAAHQQALDAAMQELPGLIVQACQD